MLRAQEDEIVKMEQKIERFRTGIDGALNILEVRLFFLSALSLRVGVDSALLNRMSCCSDCDGDLRCAARGPDAHADATRRR